ncbi:MAG: hypothetical protein AAGJ92_02695, partial [Pseudomonadota bacterium]
MGFLLLMGAFALCVTIGVPVAFALGISAIVAFWFEGLPLFVGFQRIVAGKRDRDPDRHAEGK